MNSEQKQRARELPPAIASAAREDPLIHHLTRFYIEGHLDYESFLEATVVEMAIRHATDMDRILRLEQLRPVVYHLNNPGDWPKSD